MAKRRRRNASATTTTTGNDSISNLPDTILTHILSFLATESAVATSLLSKRWKDVWITVPTLHFDRCWSRCPVKIVQIENFIDRVLSVNNVLSVREIHLRCCKKFDHSRVNAWISNIAHRDADQLDLGLVLETIYSMPDSFFRKEKLVKLNLENVVMKVPPLVSFPNLKAICLHSVQFLGDDSMENLLFGCPVLSSLSIIRRLWDNSQTLYIRSSTLHKLELVTEMISHHFVIDAPNLSVLNIGDIDYADSTYEIINVSSLASTTLLIGDDKILMEVLTKGAHVKELRSSIRTWSYFIQTSLPGLPIFHNLVHFTLECIDEMGWKALPSLLHCMPKLVFVRLYKDNSGLRSQWCDPDEVPHCFSSSIETVEILNLIQGGQEIQMISYILKNASVLKKLTIGAHMKDLAEEKEFLIILLSLPRNSAGCQVESWERPGYFSLNMYR